MRKATYLVLLLSVPCSLSAQTPAGTELRVKTYTTGFQQNAQVTSQGAGGFVAAWEGPSTPQPGGSQMVFQRFDGSGGKLGSEVVASSTAGHVGGAWIATSQTGEILTVWDQGICTTSELFYRRFGNGGAPLSASARLNAISGASPYRPRIATLGGFGSVAAYKNGQGLRPPLRQRGGSAFE